MSKRKSLSDVIAELERATEDLGEKVKPHIDDLKSKAGEEFYGAKDKLEKEVKRNPWAALGIVAIVFLILGFIFAPRSRRHD